MLLQVLFRKWPNFQCFLLHKSPTNLHTVSDKAQYEDVFDRTSNVNRIPHAAGFSGLLWEASEDLQVNWNNGLKKGERLTCMKVEKILKGKHEHEKKRENTNELLQ